jgi:hypothetical protein
MMHSMHVRGNDRGSQDAIDPGRQRNVGMVELRGQEQDELVANNDTEWNANQRDDSKPRDRRESNLS